MARTRKKDPLICHCPGESAFQLRRVLALVTAEHFWEPILDLEKKEVWVNECGRPSVITFNFYLKRCIDCMAWFSSPWEEVCVECFKGTPAENRSHSGPYRGWRWARRRMDEQREFIRNL